MRYILLSGVLFIASLTWLVSSISSGVHKEIDSVESKVGSRVILQRDTLMIIDYSIFKSSYTLEDGREISQDLVKKLKSL